MRQVTISESITPPVLPVATTAPTWAWLTNDLRRRRRGDRRRRPRRPCRRSASRRFRSICSAPSSTGSARRRASAAASPALVGVRDRRWPRSSAGSAPELSTYLITRLGEQTVADLREDVLERALNLPATMIEESGRGDLLSRVGADVAAVAKAVSQVLPDMLNAFFLGVVTLVGMTSIDWRLGLAGALCIPAYAAGVVVVPAAVGADVRRATRRDRRPRAGHRGVDPGRPDHRRLRDPRPAARRHRPRASARARDISVAVFRLFTRLVGRVNRAEFIGLDSHLGGRIPAGAHRHRDRRADHRGGV